MSLGNWAVIDIETTGINPSSDHILDIGFLAFTDTKLVKKYSSLVQYEGKISQFIQKLTGINQEMAVKAPPWRETEAILGELEGHYLLAHNANFEAKFLSKYFQTPLGENLVRFQDSLLFLGLLFLDRKSLSLESFIVDFKIEAKETHRGLEDSLDLLKVLLVSCGLCLREKKYRQRKEFLLGIEQKYKLEEMWCFGLLKTSEEEISAIANTIEFDLWKKVDKLQQTLVANPEEPSIESNNDADNLNFSRDFTGENIKSIWRDKQINQLFPHYIYRKEQEELSLKVGQSFKNNIHAIIQAPTGTGKTLGYLLPTALFATSEKKPVLIATGTKVLQQQIMQKDIPLLQQILPIPKGEAQLKVTSLVGSQNHLCELLYRRSQEEDTTIFNEDSFETRYAFAVLDILFAINDLEDQQLMRGDIPYILKKINDGTLDTLEKDVAVDFRSCIGKKCPYKGSCSYIQGLHRARDADIIVGNHSLMFRWPKGLTRPGHIIVDEAHKTEREVSSAFALQITQWDFKRLVQSLDNLQGVGALFYLIGKQAEVSGEHEDATATITKIRKEVRAHGKTLEHHINSFHQLCEQYFKRRPRYSPMYWNEAPVMKKNKLNDELSQAIHNHLKSFDFIIQDLFSLLTPYANSYSAQDLEEENELVAFNKFESFYANLEEYHECLSKLMAYDSQYTSSFSFHEEYGFTLESIPIDVGKVVHDQLLQSSQSVIFTSATLGNMSGDIATQGMEWPLGYHYLDPKRRYRAGLFLPPIYNYKENAKVFLCDDTPSMHDQKFIPTVLAPIMQLVQNLKGKSLLLFSSRVRFEAAREVLLEKIAAEFPLFIQGMGNNIVEEYRKSPQGILLGMESFGEGIDLPGESLQFVFIDKIPDIRQDLVIQERRDFFQKSFGNEFTDYFLANRAKSLAQKLGRLLRREQDVGGAIIVDNRIKRWQGRTISQFLHLMTPYQVLRSPLQPACEEIYQFIRSHSRN